MKDGTICIGTLFCKSSGVDYYTDIPYYMFPIGKKYNILDWYIEHMSFMGVDIIYIISDELVYQEVLNRRHGYVYDYSILSKQHKNKDFINRSNFSYRREYKPKKKMSEQKIIPIVVHNIPEFFKIYDFTNNKIMSFFFGVYDVFTLFRSMLQNDVCFYMCDCSVFFPFTFQLRDPQKRNELFSLRNEMRENGVLFSVEDGDKKKDFRDNCFLPFSLSGDILEDVGKKLWFYVERKQKIDLKSVFSFVDNMHHVFVERVYDISSLSGYGRLLVDQGSLKEEEKEVFFGLYFSGKIDKKLSFSAISLIDFLRWKAG